MNQTCVQFEAKNSISFVSNGSKLFRKSVSSHPEANGILACGRVKRNFTLLQNRKKKIIKMKIKINMKMCIRNSYTANPAISSWYFLLVLSS